MSDVHTRLLRETLRGRMTRRASPECIDTEMLAAWSDGTLRVRRRAAIEAHAANCARCQALLAAMAVTAPVPARRAWWQATTLKWFVPLAAATVALVLWINVSQPRRETLRLQPPIPSRQLPVAGSPLPATATARADSTAFAEATAVKAAPSESASRRRAGGDKARATADDKRVAASTALKLDDAAAPRTEARDTATAAPRSLEAAAPPAADALARGAAETVAPAGVAGNASTRPITGAQIGGQTFGARMEVMSKVTVVPPLIVSADGGARWRILAAGAVERSIDGGVTWQAQSTGVFVTLTAGSAPSQLVCWLVGPRGTVLRSTDGSAWERVPFPGQIDLASIRATDHLAATVRTPDGRVYSTVDGGKTWTR